MTAATLTNSEQPIPETIQARLLVVDDIPAEVTLMQRALTRGAVNAEIDRVETEKDLEKALQQPHDVALVDCLMPTLTPELAVECIRSRDPLMPIVLVTGRVDVNSLPPLVTLGVRDVVLKDEIHRLPQVVRSLIQWRKSQEEAEEAERARRQADIRYKALFEQAMDGVLLAEVGSKVIIDANKAAGDMLGGEPSALIGRTCEEVLKCALPDGFSCQPSNEETGASSQGATVFETTLSKNGDTLEVEISVLRLEVPGDQPILQIILHDISDRKRLERERQEHTRELERRIREATRELTERNKELQAANDATHRFLRRMNHELRTPLTTVTLVASNLRDTLPEESQRSSANAILGAAHLFDRLISDMADITAIETGSVRFDFGTVDPKELCEASARAFAAAIAEKSLVFSMEIDPRVESIRGDLVRLQQVLSNLIGNSVKYTDAGGSIAVRVSPESSDTVRIDVSDTGIGISQADLSKIFEEFYRAEAVAKRIVGGDGIGLALAKLIVDKHGGTINVESQEGQGTTFTILLPGTCCIEGAS